VTGGCDLIYDGSIGGLRSRMCRVAAISYMTGASGGCDLIYDGSIVSVGCDLIYDGSIGWLRSRMCRAAAISYISSPSHCHSARIMLLQDMVLSPR